MSITKREIEDIKSKPFKVPIIVNFIFSILSPLSKIPAIRKYIGNSSGGLNGQIIRHCEKQEYDEATKIALRGLEKYRNKKSLLTPFMDHHTWWQFMELGVESAKNSDTIELRDKLMEYAASGIEPFEGYYVANSYLEFSKWKYQAHEYEKAIEYAKTASKADSTWAEPDFILGWFSLVLGNADAEAHLSKAIEKDPRILFRIANNDICKQYPHIINKLKAKHSKANNS
jgi:tetratricopeptide (TPR) repeat protein